MPTIPNQTHRQFNLYATNDFAEWLRDLARLDRRTPTQELQYLLEMLFGKALWEAPDGANTAFEILTEMIAEGASAAKDLAKDPPCPVIPQGERGAAQPAAVQAQGSK